jgi:flavin reductase (DIM6/NTAB) family NADH-FMN oxidoreductase RutF
MASASAQAFIQAMRGAVTGVTVVTTDGPAGRFGLTLNSFVSVSAEPPMVLVCVGRNSPACNAVEQNRSYCVNVLSGDQRTLADIFAGRGAGNRPYDFGAAHWTRQLTGSPALSDAKANFDCVLDNSFDAGTHRIFTGRVIAATARRGKPLLYTNREYGQPRPFINTQTITGA